MASRLFNLRNVPEDEAEEVRRLLETHRIDYYETPPSPWGISMGALWLRDDDDRDRAERLLAAYQADRARAAREAYERLRREGRHESLLDGLRDRPLQAAVYTAIIALVLYFSIKPFLDLGA